MAGDCKEESDLYASTLTDDNSIYTQSYGTTWDINDPYTEEGGGAEKSLILEENGELLSTKIEIVTTNVLSSSSLNSPWTLVTHRRNSRKRDNNSKLISKLPSQGSKVVIRKKEHGLRKDTPHPSALTSKVKVVRYPFSRFTKYSDQLLDTDISGLKAKSSGTEDCKLRVKMEHLVSGADRMDKKNKVHICQNKSLPMQSSVTWNKETLLLVLLLCIMAVHRSNSEDYFQFFPFPDPHRHTYDEAAKVCKEHDMILPEPRNLVYNNAVKTKSNASHLPASVKKPPMFFLGMRKRTVPGVRNTRQWTWESDNSTVTWFYWQTEWGEPNNPTTELCAVQLGYYGQVNGGSAVKWGDTQCGHWIYINAVLCAGGCSGLFTRVKDSCYKVVHKRLSFDQAADECKKMSAELAQPSYHQYPQLLRSVFPKNLKLGIWMGIKKQNGSWTYLSAYKKSDWMNGYGGYWPPSGPSGDGDCVQAFRHPSSKLDHWDARNCKDKAYFVCEKSLIEADLYYVKINGKVKWQEAQQECSKINGRLPEPRSTYEINKLKTFMSNFGMEGVWLDSLVTRPEYRISEWRWNSDWHLIGLCCWAPGQPYFYMTKRVEPWCLWYKLNGTGWAVEKCIKDRTSENHEIVCQLKTQTPERDKFYVHLQGKDTWVQANARCQKVKGILPEPRSQEENYKMKIFAADHGIRRSVWMGSRKHLKGDPWVWHSDGHQISYNDWAPGEPKYDRRYEPGGPVFCMVFVMSKLAWYDFGCSRKIEIICQIHTHECPSGFELHGSLCYKCLVCGRYNSEGVTWEEARKKCEKIEARLVEPKWKEQYDAMATMLSKNKFSGSLWIGGHRSHDGKTWRWNSNNQEIIWFQWCKGPYCPKGPTSYIPQSNTSACLTYINQNGVVGWNASDCSERSQIMCQTEMMPVPAQVGNAAQGNVTSHLCTLLVVIMSVYTMCHVSMD